MGPLREYDRVRVARLIEANRPFSGSAGVRRPPRVGDDRTVVAVYDSGDEAAPVAVEKVDPNGSTIWLADFLPHELQRLDEPG